MDPIGAALVSVAAMAAGFFGGHCSGRGQGLAEGRAEALNVALGRPPQTPKPPQDPNTPARRMFPLRGAGPAYDPDTEEGS